MEPHKRDAGCVVVRSVARSGISRAGDQRDWDKTPPMRRTRIAKGIPSPVRAATKADLYELRPMENCAQTAGEIEADADGRVETSRHKKGTNLEVQAVRHSFRWLAGEVGFEINFLPFF